LLLGKIQIGKTSGLSNYLYTLAIPDKNGEQCKATNKLIFKLVWNKTNNNNNDHHQIKGQTMHQNEDLAIFGMVKLHNLMITSRMRRYMILLDNNKNPLAICKDVLALENTESKWQRCI